MKLDFMLNSSALLIVDLPTLIPVIQGREIKTLCSHPDIHVDIALHKGRKKRLNKRLNRSESSVVFNATH